MLLTELILAKRGPLAKVWLSAHHERKLSKQQALGVDVEESVEAILTQEAEPLTLRISGQLMLGVVRIYSRKVQYLMDDCKETRERISMAFRPGIVDLPEDQVRASKNAITFSETQNILDWTFSVPEFAPRGMHTAPLSHTNLRSTREYGAFNFGRPVVPSIYGGSTPSRHGSQDIEISSHLDSGDFSGIDLGLDLEDVEMAREVASERTRSASLERSKTPGLNDQDVFAPLDLGLDFDFDQPVADDRIRRESSALTTPPPQSPEGVLVAAPTAAAAPKRLRVVRADDELELPDEDFAAPQDGNVATTYISADPDAVRLQEIIADPASFFLPTIVTDASRYIYSGPLGLAPELADLFTFPANILRRDVEPPSKRARTDTTIEVEDARRGSVVPPSEPYDTLGGFDMSNMDISGQDFDIPEFEPVIESTPRKTQRMTTPSESIIVEAPVGGHPLAAFDARHRDVQGEFDSRLSESILTSKSERADVAAANPGGVSKNTALALDVLRRELKSGCATFERVAAKASKRAASAFFFELLVLGTRDCLKMDQHEAFGEISISAKPKLFDGVTA